MSVRKGVTRLEIRNDGHGAFIHDETHPENLRETTTAEEIKGPKPRILDGVFCGTLFRGSFGAQTNLTRRHIEALGLRFGMRLRIEFGEADHEAVYLGRMPANLLPLLYGSADDVNWKGEPPRLCACVLSDDQLPSEAVALMELESQLDGPVEPLPVTISIVDPAVLPAFDRHYLADRRIEGHTIYARTFLATRRGWGVNVGSTELAAAGAALKQPAVLEIAGQRFIVYPGIGPDEHRSVVEASAHIDTATRARVQALRAEIETIEAASWDAEPDEQAVLEAHRLELKRLIEELLYPPALRHTAPLYGWFTPFWEGDGEQIMLVLPMIGDTMPEGVTVGDRVVLTGSVPF